MRDFRVVRTIQKDPFTFVELEQDVRVPGGGKATIRGTGMAKRSPLDPVIPAVGIEIASERAKSEIRSQVKRIKNKRG